MNRKLASLTLAGMAACVLPLVAAGCGSDELTVADGVGPGPASSEPATSEPASGEPTTNDAEHLTELARVASDQLRQELSDRGQEAAGILAAEPETWWATFDVEIPLDADQLDDPLAALPSPLDALAPFVVELRVRGDTPTGSIGVRSSPPFADLRAQLDGSTQPVTTHPGDDPPATATWPVDGATIVRLWVPVSDVDTMATTEVEAILDRVGLDRVRLGPPEAFSFLTVAEADAGVVATLPPSTGTVPPAPPTDD